MKILEIYAGSRSFSKECEKRGHNTFCIDIKQFGGIDLIKDCEFLTLEDLPFIPDILWSGTPCTTYSVAALWRHRDQNFNPKSEFAEKCDRMNINNLKLINELLKLNPKMLWYIENPRGALRKMYFMKGIQKSTVWYCKYGDFRAKPTDIFSNNIYSIFNPEGWESRPGCYNGNKNCHHEKSPRGSNGGTQGQSGNHDRSKMPRELCKEIILASEKKIKNDKSNWKPV